MVGKQRRLLIASIAGILLLLCLAIALALTTDLDRQISNAFYDPETGRWLIDHDSSAFRLWFYDGPKALIILFGLALIMTMIRPTMFPAGWFTRREAVFIFTCLAIIPISIGALKKNSNVQCPVVLQQYGGTQSDEEGHISLAGLLQASRPGGCWPSGHASGGFALLCLAWLNRRRRTRQGFAALGLASGLMMGGYQLARGAHFASHVVVTGLIAVLLVVVLAELFNVRTAAIGDSA